MHLKAHRNFYYDLLYKTTTVSNNNELESLIPSKTLNRDK